MSGEFKPGDTVKLRPRDAVLTLEKQKPNGEWIVCWNVDGETQSMCVRAGDLVAWTPAAVPVTAPILIEKPPEIEQPGRERLWPRR